MFVQVKKIIKKIFNKIIINLMQKVYFKGKINNNNKFNLLVHFWTVLGYKNTI